MTRWMAGAKHPVVAGDLSNNGTASGDSELKS